MKEVLLLKKECPKCGGSIVWSMNNLKIGASSIVTCTNGVGASRVDWNAKESVICDWSGKVVRLGNGKFQFYFD